MSSNVDYAQALELRLGWLRWAAGTGLDLFRRLEVVQHCDMPLPDPLIVAVKDTGRSFQVGPRHKIPRNTTLQALALFEANLNDADAPTYFMNRYVCESVEHLRKTVPDDMVWKPEWMQSRSGWMMLADPFKIDNPITTGTGDGTIDIHVGIKAIGWVTVPAGARTSQGRIANQDCTMFLVYQDFDISTKGIFGFNPWSYFTIQRGDVLHQRMLEYEYDAGEADGGRYDNPESQMVNMTHEMRWIFTAFNFMSQTIATTVKSNATRAQRRRFENQPPPFVPLVQVITLRRMEYQGTGNKKDKPSPVDWQWQWIVRPHGRRQYYPSTGEHQWIVIDSYVKGPEDKPLKPPTAKIFVAKR